MTEHSIEELERQHRDAASRVNQAQTALGEAKRRLTAGHLTASGLEGHLVSYERSTWRRKETETIRFIVRRVSGWKYDEVEGPIVKKDGTPGEREARQSISKVTDHGPYVAPGATP